MKKLLSAFLAFVLVLNTFIFGLAAEANGESDQAWYADAVNFCKESGLLSGTSPEAFSPQGVATRGMLVTSLHRQAGLPAASEKAEFSDVLPGRYYEAAVSWAAETGVAFGISKEKFAPDAPVTREQVAAFLWRRAGSPAAAGTAEAFADASQISPYAVPAVEWAREQGVISGKGSNRFDPKGAALRSEFAMMLYNWLKEDTKEESPSPAPGPGTGEETPEPTPTPEPAGKTLVVYFSASGSTKRVAGYAAEALNADTFELTPVTPYTTADLSWTTPGSRVNREHDDESLRDIALTADTVENWEEYSTVFIGYPIWWGIAAWPVNNFVKNNDFTGKTVIPFCTSASSGLGQSGTLLQEMAGTGNWLEGQRFNSGVDEEEVVSWVNGLDF